MANEFTVSYPTGSTLYVTAERISSGTSYTILLTDNGDGTYTGSMNTAAPLDDYLCRVYKQTGASPDTANDTILYPGETRIWSGTQFGFDNAVKRATSPYRGAMTWGAL